MTILTRSAYDAVRALLRTELQGAVAVADVERWAAGLADAVASIPEGTRFRLLLDLSGYEPAGLDAHKAMRGVVPSLLAAHGMRPAFADLFPELPDVEVTVERGVVCDAFANVHHDATKMANYDERIATSTQRFFTDRAAAEAWLERWPVAV